MPSTVSAFIPADPFSRSDLLRLPGEVLLITDRLDVLIHNAAVFTPQRRATREGIEMQFAVNHLAPYALTQMLLPMLRTAPQARIVATASQVERHGLINFADLMGEHAYDPLTAYYQSKTLRTLRILPPVRHWASTTAEGARTTVFAARAPELRGISGLYLVDAKRAEDSPQSRDIEARRRLWSVSADPLQSTPSWP